MSEKDSLNSGYHVTEAGIIVVSPRGYWTLEGAQGLMVAEERDGMYGSLGHHLHMCV